MGEHDSNLEYLVALNRGTGGGGGGGITQLTQDVQAGPGSGSQAATVVGLQDNPVPPPAGAGAALTWNGAALAWVIPPGGTAFISLANRAALLAYNPAGLATGTLIYVQTYGAYVAYNPTDTTPTDVGTLDTVFRAVGGGNYLRTASGIVPQALFQQDWYVDPVGGDNENSGQAGHPVKTVMGGIVPRWGGQTEQTRGLRIFFLNDETPGQEEIYLTASVPVGQTLQVFGNYIDVGAATTLATVTPKNRATAQLLVVTLTAPPGGLAVGQFVHNTTKGSRAVIYQDAAGTLSMGQPFTAQVLGSVGAIVEDDTWAPGDTVQVERRLQINLDYLSSISENILLQAFETLRPLAEIDCPVATGFALDCGASSGNSWQHSGGTEMKYLDFWTDSLFYTRNTYNDYGVFLLGGYVEHVLVNGACNIVLDGDLIVGQAELNFGGITYPGQFYVASEVICSELAYIAGDAGLLSTAIIWGPGSWWQFSGTFFCLGQLFVNTLLQLGGTYLGAGQYSSVSQYDRTTGVWTAGVATTPANLDAGKGCIEPQSQAAFVRP
jgi:hypothetical protein